VQLLGQFQLVGACGDASLGTVLRLRFDYPTSRESYGILIMKHRIAGLAALPSASPFQPSISTVRLAQRLPRFAQHNATIPRPFQLRGFAITTRLRQAESKPKHDINGRPAVELNNNITQEEKDHFAKKLAEDKGKQIKTPWHREGSDVPPVSRQRSASAMTKGTHFSRHCDRLD